jgi:hypothetical protein
MRSSRLLALVPLFLFGCADDIDEGLLGDTSFHLTQECNPDT